MLDVRTVRTNNTEIHFAPDARLNSFCVGAYLFAGSMYESPRDSGISHLYEHMVFRNLKRLYGGRLYELLSENGLFLEGDSYKEFMCFTVHGLASGIDFAVDLISKLFLPLEISPEEFDAEKKRIYCEMNEDDEKNTLDYLHRRRCWGEAFPAAGISGRRSNVERISVRRLDRFREEVVSAGNVFFFVTGNVDAEHERRLADAVSRIPVSPVRAGRSNMVPVPPGFVFGQPDIAVKDSDWYYIMLSFGFDSKRIPVNVREAIYSVLCDLDDCAFYQELSENDPVTYDFSGTLEQYNDLGCFTFSYETFPLLVTKSLESVVRAVNRLKSGDFDFELNRKKLAMHYTLSLDRPADLNWDLAYYGHILAGDRFADLTKDAVMNAAREIFTRKNLVVTLRGERRRIDKDGMERMLAGLDG